MNMYGTDSAEARFYGIDAETLARGDEVLEVEIVICQACNGTGIAEVGELGFEEACDQCDGAGVIEI